MTEKRTDELAPPLAARRTSITRRGFSIGVGVVLAGGGLWLVGRDRLANQAPASPSDEPLPEVSLDPLDSDAFGARVGDRFLVRPQEGEPIELVLVRIADQTSAPPGSSKPGGPRMESFTLVFRGPRERPLGQDTYQFEQAKIGAFPLFIVPGSVEGDWQHYVASFNRLA